MRPLKDKTEIGGIFGERVTVRKVNGRVMVTNRPKRKKGKPSEKLLAQRGRLTEAAIYAKAVEANAEISGLYAKHIRGKHESVYSVAIRDFFNPPKVGAIDALFYHGRVGDMIEIAASDVIMVKKVKVMISDADGTVIEQGEATENLQRINVWEYTATAINPTKIGTKIMAIAYDRPGNKGTAEIVL